MRDQLRLKNALSLSHDDDQTTRFLEKGDESPAFRARTDPERPCEKNKPSSPYCSVCLEKAQRTGTSHGKIKDGRFTPDFVPTTDEQN